jgi:glycosyltransferase involved in cell wall biosynthesis
VVLSLVHGLRERGHEVAVAAAHGELAAELPGPVHELPLLHRRPERIPKAAVALSRAITAARPQVVHCHNPGMAAVCALATLRGRRAGALVSIQGVPEEDYRAAAKTLRLAGLPVVACGPGVAAALEEHGIRVRATVLNAISAPPPPADRAALEREWELEPGMRIVLSVGRLVPQKDQHLAIRALAGVPNAVLVVLGQGPLRQELEQHAQATGVADRVVFAGVRRDVRAILGAADAVVSSSRWEGLSLATLETLAAGTPLVATDVRGNRELLGPSESALLVPAGDADAMGAALRRVLDDRRFAAELVERGRRVAAAHTDEAMVDAYLHEYELLLEERRRK